MLGQKSTHVPTWCDVMFPSHALQELGKAGAGGVPRRYGDGKLVMPCNTAGGRGGRKRNPSTFGLSYPADPGGCGRGALRGAASLLYAALRAQPECRPVQGQPC